MYYSAPMQNETAAMPLRESYTLIRDLPTADRPRERLRDAGAGALSNAELLAILLRTGSSRESALAQATRLLSAYAGLAGLRNAPFAQLCNERGVPIVVVRDDSPVLLQMGNKVSERAKDIVQTERVDRGDLAEINIVTV